jgi:hypothetical protein
MTNDPVYYRDLLNRILAESHDLTDNELKQRQIKREIAQGKLVQGRDYAVLNDKIILANDIDLNFYVEPSGRSGWYPINSYYIDDTELSQAELDQLEVQEPELLRAVARTLRPEMS